MSEIINPNKKPNDAYDQWSSLEKVQQAHAHKSEDHVVAFGPVNSQEDLDLSREAVEARMNQERQERKLITCILDDDDSHLDEHDVEGFDESRYDVFFGKVRSGEITERDEARLIAKIQTPVSKFGASEIGEQLSYDKHEAKILNYFTGDSGSEYQWINGTNVKKFLRDYPTPFDFEMGRETMLAQIKAFNSEHKYQEYVRDMDKFQQDIYGKRYEYYLTAKRLNERARDGGEAGLKPMELEEKMPLAIGELDVDRPDIAVYSCSRAETKGRDTAPSEDSFYESADSGIMAIFDGAGGEANGREASHAASECLADFDEHYYLKNVGNLANIAMRMNEKVVQTGGVSTGIIAQVRDNNGEKTLDFVNVGDSRLYIIRGGIAAQLSHDEGVGNRISNYFGRSDGFVIKDWGEGIRLMKGDRLLLCSDGVTGDWEDDSLSNEDVARLVNSGSTPAEAAKNCVLSAKKKDDRTAMVKFID